LNFGNPYDPEVYYQFVEVIKGMGEACRKFDTPVTGGNVSFYNQNPDGAVYPTPTIGMVGLLDDVNRKMTMDFKSDYDLIYLLGKSNDDIASSEYLHKVHKIEYSPAPHFDIDEELALQKKVLELIKKGLIESAHDISEGGLFISLVESGFNNELGFDIKTNPSIRKDGFLFGEAQSRVAVSVNASKLEAFEAATKGIPFEKIGIVTDGEMNVDGEDWGNITDWKQKYDNAISQLLAGHESEHALTSL